MVEIGRPSQPGASPLQSALPEIGSLVGTFYGGPLGGAAGGKAGSALAKNGQSQSAPGMPLTGDAMSRRKQALDDSPQGQIRDSIDSLKYIDDPQQRADLAAPLLKADYMARNSTQVPK